MDSLNYVLTILSREREKRDSFLSLGLLSGVVDQRSFMQCLPKIFEVVRGSLQTKDK